MSDGQIFAQEKPEHEFYEKVRLGFQTLEKSDVSDGKCRDACIRILETVQLFLVNWKRDDAETNQQRFPLYFLRETISNIVRELGPGDTLFRKKWFHTLRQCLKLEEMPRQFVLEFVPCAVLPCEGTTVVKTELLSILKHLLRQSADLLPPVVNCLKRLAETGRVQKDDVFQFLLEHMFRVPRDSTANILTCLLQHSGSEPSNLSLAVESSRKELFHMDDHEDEKEWIRPVALTMNRLVEEENYSPFFEEYLATLEEECRPSSKTHCTLGIFDMVVLLLHRDHSDHGPLVRHILENAIVQRALRSEVLVCLVHCVIVHLDDAYSSSVLFHHIIWLLLFLCLAPVQCSKLVSCDTTWMLAQDFGVALLTQCSIEKKRRLISALFQIQRECLRPLCKATNHKASSPEISWNEAAPTVGSSTTLNKVQSVVLRIFTVASSKQPSILQEYGSEFVRALCENNTIEEECVKMLCELLVRIDNIETLSSNAATSRMSSHRNAFLLSRQLLFSRCNSYGNDILASEMCVRGLMLISEIVSSGKVEQSRVLSLWQLVRFVMLPSTIRLASPRVGVHGLRALQSFRAWKERAYWARESVLDPGIFPTMTSVLMASRVVQYSNSVARSSQKEAGVLGYSCRPDCFKDQGWKRRKYHKMVFTFDALHPDSRFSEPWRWGICSKWLFDLIDTYLSLGRCRSKGKWIPDAWVEAAFDFPSRDLSDVQATNTKQKRVTRLIHEAVTIFDTTAEKQTSTKASSEKDFGEVLKQMKSKTARTEVLEFLLRCSMSYCLGLALSASVLSNTHAHFINVLDEQCDDSNRQERVEATRLMQYQLAKIYDLVAKCRVMEAAFRGVLNFNSRSKRRQRKSNKGLRIAGLQFENTNLHINVEHASAQLKMIQSTFTSTDEYVKSKVLWHCLVDPTHDTLLISRIDGGRVGSEHFKDESFDAILRLRLNVLSHLNGFLQRFSVRSGATDPPALPPFLVNELASIRPPFAQCLRLAAFLSTKLPDIPHDGANSLRTSKISTLAAAYFRLLLLTMELSLEMKLDRFQSELNHTNNPLLLVDFLCLYRCIMGTERPLTDAIVTEEPAANATSDSLKLAMNSILRHLLRCTDLAIAMELVETLSVFSLRSEVDEAKAEMVHLSWTALHSKFSRTDLLDSNMYAPYAFVESMKSLCPSSFRSSEWRTKRDTVIRETVLKLAFSKSKAWEKHSFLVQSMLRLWGFLAINERFKPLSADHLHQLFTNLQSFLSDVKETSLPRQRALRSDEDSEDGDYLPPKHVRAPRLVLPESAVPCLDSKSHIAYFQVLLYMTVASSALFFINDWPAWMDPLNGPYRELCKMVETFGSLISLYRKRIHIFHPSALPSILNTCRSMLNVVSYQIVQCSEWRSSQPTLPAEDVEAAEIDPASVAFLSRVFDAFGIHVVGTLEKLCTAIESYSVNSIKAHEAPLFGPTQKQKAKALRVKLNKTFSEIQELAAAHKLSPPRQTLADNTGEPERKRRRIEVRGFLQFEESAGESEDSNLIHAGPFTKMNQSDVAHTICPHAEGRALSRELTWDEDSSDDSFGVHGDWGRESDEEA